MSDTHEEVHEVLSNQDNIQFEELSGEESSPLNQPVEEKDDGNEQSEPAQVQSLDQEEQETEAHFSYEKEPQHYDTEEVDDAPEQDIDNDYTETTVLDNEEEFELPAGHAKQAADAVLGMANNVLEVGGGYFVKIRKHKEFYEFEEIIQVIDNQNVKNVKKIKLDDEDKALLRPLLISVLKTKAKKLTPEQQLLGAIISILMKKAQVVMEVRAENEILVERILDIVREEKGYSEQDEDYDEEEYEQQQEPEPEIHEEQQEEEQVQEPVVVEEEVVVEQQPTQSIQPEQVLEVAEDEPKETDEKDKK